MNAFYTYVYLDPRKSGTYKYGKYKFTHEPIYVGKGVNGRCKDIKRHLYNKILKDKLLKIKEKIIIEYIKEGMTEEEAFKEETKAIKTIGRIDLKDGPLCNFTNGGEGTSGFSPTKKTREKTSKRMKGNKYGIGYKHTVEAKKKITKALLGRPCSVQTREKIGNKHRGKIVSEETKNKISASHIGKVFSKETKEKMSESQKTRWDKIKSVLHKCPVCNKKFKIITNTHLKKHKRGD